MPIAIGSALTVHLALCEKGYAWFQPAWPCLPVLCLAHTAVLLSQAASTLSAAMDAYYGSGWQHDARQHQDFRMMPISNDSFTGPRTLSGFTFEGYPFHVVLSSDESFDTGASAHIYKGQSSGPWDQPLVVAVKIFGQILQPYQHELLVRELGIASQVSLCHPRILEFLGTASVGGQTALVSLYMKNGNLLEYVLHNPGCDKKKLVRDHGTKDSPLDTSAACPGC
ncbi:hypothetical protein AURDEDRAFT_174626 [Auricularia subglabra TFB-10046 SS5]|uniref:Protein kinase domain-containing protein n=1 Tax=Auricularia subglabra (strain TFB-10046 / SS5) TaxID=717982 RepID=J0WU71_AURST|nr:hypothetical protein AURDEDRAFT_174626 [Auricularia subglabra TFB-10046 SS5]